MAIRSKRNPFQTDSYFLDVSPYQRKKPKSQKEEESLASLLASGSLELKLEKEEPDGDEEDELGGGGGELFTRFHTIVLLMSNDKIYPRKLT